MEQARNAGQPLPEDLENAPELLPGLELYWQAFMELSSCRTTGMGEGPIPWTAVNSWCVRHCIEDFDLVYFHVRSMDITFLEFQAEKRKSKSAGAR